MLLGFNHNIMYKGEIFHVQTEDSGVENPNIVTLLYQGGVILCSMKTSYSDILRMENLEQVVEELMKEQHKQMMRRLKSGEFDERITSVANSQETDNKTMCETSPDEGDAGQLSASAEREDGISSPELSVDSTANHFETGNTELRGKTESLDDAILAFFGIKDS